MATTTHSLIHAQTTSSVGYVDSRVVRKLSEKTAVVCRIVLGSQGATGFLIGKNLIMTNHHVIPNIETARKAHAVFFYAQDRPDPVQVDLDPEDFFCTSPSPDQTGFEFTTKNLLDFTIVAIKPDPKITEISHLAFSIFDHPKPEEEMHANIVHYPVEQNGSSYQKVSFRKNLIKQVSQFTLHYTTATMPGSSGAPVIDDEGNLIALHRASCIHLLAALLEEKVLKALLEALFPGVKFSETIFTDLDTKKEHSVVAAQIDNSFIMVFPKGDFKGKYYHFNRTPVPLSLFELIKTKHEFPKTWAIDFLKKQGFVIKDYHQECNIAVPIKAIHTYLGRNGFLEKLKTRFEATQNTIVSILKNSYQNQLAFLSLFLSNQTFPIESFFTQLIIVSSSSQEKKEKEIRDPHLVEKDSLRELHARLTNPESPLEIKTIFDDRDQKPVKRVLILGRAGIGKSTLCQKIAYDWAQGRLFEDKFEIVFHLKLRELNGWIKLPENQLKSVGDPDQWLSCAIALLCYEKAYSEKILQAFKDQPEKILIMLDGWDEAAPELIQALKLCLQKSQIPHFLLTSRPGVTSDIHSNFDLMAENMGFNPFQIKDYATKFFQYMKSSEAESFLSHLRNHSDLFALAHIPIQLQILCALWHKGVTEFPQTLAAMMSKIVDHLFDWEESKKNERTPVSQKRILYQALGQVALKGLDRRQLIFSKAIVEDVLANFSNLRSEDLIGTGLVKGCGNEGEMYFIHLSYQEYAIAKSISELPEMKQKHFVQDYKYKQHFQLVIRLLAGCLWEKTKDFKILELLFEWLSEEPLDLLGVYQTELILTCLEECQSPQLEEMVWNKCQIANFVERLFSQKEKPEVLVRYMKVSQKVFLTLLKTVQQSNRKSDIEWFLKVFPNSVKAKALEIVLGFIKTVLLSDQTSKVRIAAAGSIEKIAAQVKESQVGILLELLKTVLTDQDSEVRKIAAGSIKKIAAQVKESQVGILLELLKTVLTDQDSEVRKIAAKALENIVSQVKESHLVIMFECLKLALAGQDFCVRSETVKVVGKIAGQVKELQVGTLLEFLKTALVNSNSEVRRAATEAIGKIAGQGKESQIGILLELLKTALADRDSEVRRAATEAIGKIAGQGKESQIGILLEFLKTALADRNSEVRRAAAEEIGKIVGQAKESQIRILLDFLKTAVSDQDSKIRKATAEAIGKIPLHMKELQMGILLEFLKTALADRDSEVRSAAFEALGEIAVQVKEPHVGTLVEFLKTALANRDSEVRRAAVEALGKIAAQLKESYLGTLFEWIKTALTDRDSEVRRAAAEALGKIAAQVKESNLETLFEWIKTALADQSSWVRTPAAGAIGKIKVQVKQSQVGTLLDLLKTALANQDSDLQIEAIGAIEKIAAQVKELQLGTLLDLLKTVLANQDSDLQREAAKVILQIAANIKESHLGILLDWLKIALVDQDSYIRRVAAQSIGLTRAHLKEPRLEIVLDCLKIALADQDVEVRRGAARAIEKIAAQLKESRLEIVLDCFKTALADQDVEVRRGAARAIKEIAEWVKESYLENLLDSIKSTLADQDSEVRTAAAEAIGKIAGQVKESHLESLLDCLKTTLVDQSRDVRREAVCSIGEIGTRVEESHLGTLLDYLKTALVDQSRNVRIAAAEAVGKIAAQVKELCVGILLDWIKTALADRDFRIRSAAAEAIGKIAAQVKETHLVAVLDCAKTGLADQEYNVRKETAAAMLKAAGQVKESHLGTLLDWAKTGLADQDHRIRTSAALAIRNIGVQVKDSELRILIECLKTKMEAQDYWVSSTAPDATGRIAAQFKKSHLEILIECLKTTLAAQGYWVYNGAPGAMGKTAAQVKCSHLANLLEFLKSALADKSWRVRGKAEILCNNLKKESLLFILSDPILIQHPLTHQFIIPRLIDQGILIFLSENSKNGCLLHLGEYSQTISLQQKELILSLLKEKNVNSGSNE